MVACTTVNSRANTSAMRMRRLKGRKRRRVCALSVPAGSCAMPFHLLAAKLERRRIG
jgi:hypothetical protein